MHATRSIRFIPHDQIILLAVVWFSIFTEAIPSYLSLNKLHLFTLTQDKFILIQTVPLHVCHTFRPVLRPPCFEFDWIRVGYLVPNTTGWLTWRRKICSPCWHALNFARFPETSVTDYKLILSNIPEERRSCWQMFFFFMLSFFPRVAVKEIQSPKRRKWLWAVWHSSMRHLR